MWFRSSGFFFVVSPGFARSCGSIILYRPLPSLVKSWSDSDGRFLFVILCLESVPFMPLTFLKLTPLFPPSSLVPLMLFSIVYWIGLTLLPMIHQGRARLPSVASLIFVALRMCGATCTRLPLASVGPGWTILVLRVLISLVFRMRGFFLLLPVISCLSLFLTIVPCWCLFLSLRWSLVAQLLEAQCILPGR